MKYERKMPIDLKCGVTVYYLMAGGKWKPCLIHLSDSMGNLKNDC